METDIKINIYNTAVALISSVEMGTLNAGSHEYSWNAGNLPGGIYFYSIRAADIGCIGNTKLLK